MTDLLQLPIRVAEDGTVTFPDKLPFNQYRLPWVTGAEDTLPERTRRKYPNGRLDLQKKLKFLRSKRAQHGAVPRAPAFANLGGTSPKIDGGDS